VSSANATEQFLRDYIKSVWSLEVLLHLAGQSDRAFTPEELVTNLRASTAVVASSCEALQIAGLVVAEDGGRVRYVPASADLAAAVDRLREEYAVRPDALRRIIVSTAAGGASAFADAFRLRRD
jgi:hypothetical protein